MTAEQYIQHLNLQPHPEGGFYKQNYTSSEFIPSTALPQRFRGKRPFSTAIYYLLQRGDFSTFHKIKSDECWHFYGGSTLHIHMIEKKGNYIFIKLGNRITDNELIQCIVPSGTWFAVEPAPNTDFALTGCTVAPGFDFEDFQIGDKATLLQLFPMHSIIIERLCRV